MKTITVVLALSFGCFGLGAPSTRESEQDQRIRDMSNRLIEQIRALDSFNVDTIDKSVSEMKDRLSYVFEYIISMQKYIQNDYDIKTTDEEKLIREIKSIGVETVRKDPSLMLRLFDNEPMSAERVKMTIVWKGLMMGAETGKGIVAAYEGEKLARLIYRLSEEVQYGLKLMYGITEQIERYIYELDSSNKPTTSDGMGEEWEFEGEKTEGGEWESEGNTTEEGEGWGSENESSEKNTMTEEVEDSSNGGRESEVTEEVEDSANGEKKREVTEKVEDTSNSGSESGVTEEVEDSANSGSESGVTEEVEDSANGGRESEGISLVTEEWESRESGSRERGSNGWVTVDAGSNEITESNDVSGGEVTDKWERSGSEDSEKERGEESNRTIDTDEQDVNKQWSVGK